MLGTTCSSFFNNPFSPDISTPSNKTTPLDEADDGDTFSTCRELNFSSFIYPSAAVSNISDINIKNVSSIYIG